MSDWYWRPWNRHTTRKRYLQSFISKWRCAQCYISKGTVILVSVFKQVMLASLEPSYFHLVVILLISYNIATAVKYLEYKAIYISYRVVSSTAETHINYAKVLRWNRKFLFHVLISEMRFIMVMHWNNGVTILPFFNHWLYRIFFNPTSFKGSGYFRHLSRVVERCALLLRIIFTEHSWQGHWLP